ncbi:MULTISPECIES: aldehyde dehydrogenase family protein [unclassified Streptomyces]|uniref:aldehyde dehydrogenase family protein n=1 Tax=unclassified Streptomyces TaxID=2593676 RepID=UPI0022B6F0BB|nr:MULTISPECIES: aldehyde dehydrogenase family protein [unclassified Streptomyces]MCZ7416812.1 aldehyde dehydrogenase family protein [Streptomyces sp. WMMC897]MCZ7433378.1 aldehyde dehydrogenase family protein [Streptomyces sp. WMMC1477]
MSALPVVNPVIAGREVDSRDRSTLTAVDGSPLASVGLAPRLMAQAALNRLRSADAEPAPDAALFAKAGELFATAELDGESPQEYCRRVALATGTPLGAVTGAREGIRNQLSLVERLNQAELPAPFAAPGFATHWVPRGDLLAAVVPNNHPEPNVTWVRALAMGVSVLVRPGSKDPFTPRRLVAALSAAGLDPDRAALLPGGHEVGEHLLAEADLGLVYGGPAAAERFGSRRDVLVRGPGRSKALVGPGAAQDEGLLDDLVEWIADDGGVRCNNISLVLTSGPVAPLADALAARLATLPVRPVTDPDAALPAMTGEAGAVLAEHLAGMTAHAVDHSTHRYADGLCADPGDGSAVLRPLVVSVPTATDPLVGTELGFPFVVVAPWRPQDGTAPLRESLVVSLPDEHAGLAGRVLREPSVRKVVTGRVRPWASVPETPHDGSLAQFLLEPKGLVSAPAES